MSKSTYVWLCVSALVVLTLLGTVAIKRPSTIAGGLVSATRTTYTTLDGNVGSTTIAGNGYVFINPAAPAGSVATSTLVVSVQGVDNVSFFGAINASSSAAVTVGVQFWESMDTGCTANTASTTWYAMSPVNLASLTATQALASSTTYTFNQGATSSIPSFTFDVPEVPAQCIQARVFSQAGGNFAIWYGLASTRYGYNNGN